jgi:hypothetical protein
MKRLIYIFFALATVGTLHAQDYGRNLGAVSVTYNGSGSKTFKYADDLVELSIPKESISEITVQAKNVSSSPIYFNWSESYFVLNEETVPVVDNAAGSAAAFGLATKEVNSVAPNAKIANGSKVDLKIGSKKGMFWDYRDANNYFKQNGKPREDKLVLVFEQDGKKLEKTIPIQVYTSKIVKQLKK